MSRKSFAILMIVFILSAIGIFISWEKFFRQQVLYETVVVSKVDLKRGDIIDIKDLAEKQVIENTAIEGAIDRKTIKEILGKEVVQSIPKGAQIVKEFAVEKGTLVKEGESTFQLPEDWVYSIPSTVRRGDSVILYAISSDDSQLATLIDRLDGSEVTVDLIENLKRLEIENRDEAVTHATVLPEDIFSDMAKASEFNLTKTLLHVFDSSGIEVTTVINDEDRFGTQRTESSAAPATVEFTVTESEINALNYAYQLGYQFIVLGGAN